MIFEEALYHEDKSSCFIHSFSALSKGRTSIVRLNPLIFDQFRHKDDSARLIREYIMPDCEVVGLSRVDQ